MPESVRATMEIISQDHSQVPPDYLVAAGPGRYQQGAVEARTKLLTTLSDGKPDGCEHLHRGEYGIEDTRQALFEARLAGIHL